MKAFRHLNNQRGYAELLVSLALLGIALRLWSIDQRTKRMEKQKEKTSINQEVKPFKLVYDNGMKSPYNHPHWRLLRKDLLKSHPLCKMCLENKLIKKADHIDHIHGFNSRSQFFDRDNLQPLCISCHSKKTHTAGGPDWIRRQKEKLGEKTWDY